VRARDAFLSIAAHELRTPVTGLKGAAQLLLRRLAAGRLDPDRLARTLRALGASADRLAVLTDDLLDIARIRMGHLALTLQPTDLAALMQAAVTRAGEHAGPAHRLTLHLPDQLAPVLTDEARIDQVLTNLLDNAVKYSPAGGDVTVMVRAAPGRVIVSVRDEGIGLPPGAATAIFEPFGRAANAAASHLPGMGLGLHICRTIVERHGGAIQAESAGEGRGTTVWFWLPATTTVPMLEEAAVHA
jgi:signal transduction histidine kinase